MNLSAFIKHLDTLNHPASTLIIQQLLSDLKVSLSKLKPFCLFGDTGYKRNKIAGTKHYDLFLICWKANQSSLIHDHGSSACGLKILEGIATEYFYRKTGKHSQVIVESKKDYPTHSICISKDLDIHRVCNENTTSLITLHVYSPSLQMNYYEELSSTLTPLKKSIPSMHTA